MKQYIDKSAVVAEIEKYISNYKGIWNKVDKSSDGWVESTLMLCSKIDVLQHILSYLDTLEVKEVDLEKEIDDYWCSLFCDYKMKRVAGHKFVPVPEYIDENFNQCENGKTQIAYVLELDWKTDFNDVEWNGDDVIKFARYFYELGLKAKKGE